MKRFFLSLAVLVIGTVSLFAQKALTKEYNFGKITSIDASSIYELEVTHGNSGKVTVEYDDENFDVEEILSSLDMIGFPATVKKKP